MNKARLALWEVHKPATALLRVGGLKFDKGANHCLQAVPSCQLAKNNADQVSKIRTILEALSFEVATSDEARAMLQLKGGDQVAF